MSTDRQHGKLIFACDSCEITEEFDRDMEFAAAWSQLKRDGWEAKKIGADWVHGCPTCGVE